MPTARERWLAGGAVIRDDGSPVFDLEITETTAIEREPFYDKSRSGTYRRIGEVITRQFVTSDGIDRRSRLWLPDKYSGTLTGQSGTAFTTSIDGYAEERARRIAARVAMPVIQHDAEYSGGRQCWLGDIRRLPAVLASSQGLSLAKSAQSEMLITKAWQTEFDIPGDIAAFGDSYDAMTTIALPTYADMYDLKVPYIDPKAPVLLDPIEPSTEGLELVAKWLRTEMIGGVAVLSALLAEGDLATLRGTISLKPNFWAGSMSGIAPMLLGGGTRQFLDWLPHDTIGYVNLYEKDLLCDVAAWEEVFQPFDRIATNRVPTGIHASLLSRIAHSKQRGRLHRLHNQNLIHGDNYDRFDAEHIHGSYLGLPDEAADLAIGSMASLREAKIS